MERKLGAIALALVLVLAGALLAVPGNQWRWFALGIGVILLVKILAQRLAKIDVRRGDWILAGVALAAGAIGLAFPEWPFLPVVVVAAGIAPLGAAVLGRGVCRS